MLLRQRPVPVPAPSGTPWCDPPGRPSDGTSIPGAAGGGLFTALRMFEERSERQRHMPASVRRLAPLEVRFSEMKERCESQTPELLLRT